MSNPVPRIYQALAFAGALPFVACAVGPFFDIAHIERIGALDYIAAVYGLAIVSFMSGAHWGTYLYRHAESPVNLFISSNVITVIAWLSILLVDIELALVGICLLFAYLLFIDYRLLKSNLIGSSYFRTRLVVTLIVICSLAVSAAGS